MDVNIFNKFKDLSDIEKNNIRNSYSNIGCYINYFYKYNDDIYHVKKFNDKLILINELLGDIITNYLGLYIDDYDVCYKHNNYYLIAKSFIEFDKKYCNIISGLFPNLSSIGFDYKLSLDSINKLDIMKKDIDGDIIKTDKDDLEKLKHDLSVMIVSDFIRNQYDRSINNFMLEYDNNYVKLMPLYDFSSSFLNTNYYNENAFIFNLSDRECEIFIKKEKYFISLLYMAYIINFDKILEELNNVYGIKMSLSDKKIYEGIIDNKKREIERSKILKKIRY